MEKIQVRKMKRVSYYLFPLMLPFLLIGLFFSLSEAAEKPYPIRAIKMIVPYAPGGAADLSSKIVADKISIFLGQPIISLYKPGGGGTLGATFVAKAKPDGYTILNGSSGPLVLSPILKKLDYTLDDFIVTNSQGIAPYWFAVKANARWKTLKEFVEEAKEFPGKLSVSSYGALTPVHFMIELLNKYEKIRLTHVPYKSSGEALFALLGGHADGGMVSGAGGLLESGAIRILAVAEEQRLEGLPDVPTFKELGYPIVLNAIHCLCFPKGTPKEIVDKFCEAQQNAFKKYSQEIKEGLRKVEFWGNFMTPQETLNKYKEQHGLLLKVAQEMGVVGK